MDRVLMGVLIVRIQGRYIIQLSSNRFRLRECGVADGRVTVVLVWREQDPPAPDMAGWRGRLGGALGCSPAANPAPAAQPLQ